jgi:hypothetical protein
MACLEKHATKPAVSALKRQLIPDPGGSNHVLIECAGAPMTGMMVYLLCT